EQPPHHGPAEEPAPACDERFHFGSSGIQSGPSCLSAHTASFSRKIFELCRTSTGKSRFSRKVVIRRVCSCFAPASRRRPSTKNKLHRSALGIVGKTHSTHSTG